jgi:hypothetical protein
MMAVPVEVLPTFSAGKPAALFDAASYFTAAVGRNYDASADGKRFVMVKNPAAVAGRSLPITVVLDWLDEIRGKAK